MHAYAADSYLDTRGQRLLPHIIDRLGKEERHKAWASIPLSENIKEGFQDVSYHQLAMATDALAWWIESRIGQSKNFETVAYLGSSDLRYNIIFVALIKTGYKMLPLSPRNSAHGHAELINGTDCPILLYSNGVSQVEELKAIKPTILAIEVPELSHLLATQDIPRYPYDKTFEAAQYDPIMVAHSSGTTGKPKPITWTHSLYATVDAHSIPESVDGRENIYEPMRRCQRHFSTMPVAHSSSFVRFLRCILLGVTLVVLPGRAIGTDRESLAAVGDVLDHGNVDAAHFVPAVLQLLVKDKAHLNRLSRLGLIGWGGAPLPNATGNVLAKVCRNTVFHNSLGSTDGGAYVTYRTDPEDWDYICYCPFWNGIEWREHGEGLYEMVIVKDPKCALFQGPFKIHPELQEWSTKDVYSKHPTKPNHWRRESRIDELVVLANGAKFNPSRLESQIEEIDEVWSALIVGGADRLRPALLIELRESKNNYAKRHEISDAIWSIVSRANESSPIGGRILRSLIFFAPPEKRFARASKGTVQRPATVDLFKQELDELYATAGSAVRVWNDDANKAKSEDMKWG